MENINNGGRSPLTGGFLAEIKKRVTQDGIDDKIRNDNLDKIIMDLEWYMRARKLFEANEYDESVKVMEANPDKYKEMAEKYGSLDYKETPKLSIRELELFIQDVKALPRILFPSQ